uniref:Uncharacterized protein n=1 Tax=Arundo donax TaxID=35708 RepID=A0A0A9AHV5_ARUDO
MQAMEPNHLRSPVHHGTPAACATLSTPILQSSGSFKEVLP